MRQPNGRAFLRELLSAGRRIYLQEAGYEGLHRATTAARLGLTHAASAGDRTRDPVRLGDFAGPRRHASDGLQLLSIAVTRDTGRGKRCKHRENSPSSRWR
jgi:hypothetical protein